MNKKTPEIYIKNLSRKNPPIRPDTNYQPEYQRLNKDPIIFPMRREDAPRNIPKQKRDVPSQTIVNSGQNEELVWNLPHNVGQIMYDDVELPQEISGQEAENEEDVSNNLVNIEVGQYILFYEDVIIDLGSLEYISDKIEELVLNDENTFDIDNFSVFKKMSIKTGVLISNE
jgi:hypothetical protein